jgi:hypothetical protein
MIDIKKIKLIEDKIKLLYDKLKLEKDYRKKQIINLKIKKLNIEKQIERLK